MMDEFDCTPLLKAGDHFRSKGSGKISWRDHLSAEFSNMADVR